jgi:hypothetical protein
MAFPLLLRVGLAASGVLLGEVARWAWLPALALGAALAVVLVGIRLGLEPSTLPAVLGTAVGGVLAYWVAFYGLVLTTNERAFVRSLVRA